MCKITDIQIERFRGIKYLKAGNFKRVNVLLGNNNSSKSSTLEAIMILMGASKPGLSLEMNINRNYNFFKNDDILLFFHNMEKTSPIFISADFEGKGKRVLDINYFESETQKAQISKAENGEMLMQSMYGLRFDYTDNDKIKNNSKLSIIPDENEIKSETTERNSIRKSAAFVAPRYNFNDFIKHFNQIVTDKEKDTVLDILRNVEHRVKDITIIEDKVMVDIGLSKLIPINVLGDGTRKIFTIITAMYSVKGGILIIDEVDNGLYYKSMGVLWSALLKVANMLDVQLFVSTHSIDSLNALNDTLENECGINKDDVSIYTLRHKDDDNIVVLDYNYDSFNYLLSRKVEIR